MRRLAIVTENERLYHKVRLLCEGAYLVLHRLSSPAEEAYDLAVVDSSLGCEASGRTLSIEARFSLADLGERLAALADINEESSLLISEKESAVILRGRKIKLTETELRTFKLLFDAEGFVEREKILRTVFGEGTSESAVNVYIHYLREKLEADGERIIISSRKYGYKIDEKWRKS